MLAAAHPALNRAGEGSTPSGPTREAHWSFSGEDSAPVMRRRGFESHPVLSLRFFDNSVTVKCAHDVAAACRLAMAEVRVRLPLGAPISGVWESLAIPPVSGTGDRWFKSNCADSIAVGPVVVRAGAC